MQAEQKLGMALGGLFFGIVVSLMVWQATAPVYVPKPRRHAERVIQADVCGFELEEVETWAKLVPICDFEFHALPSPGPDCVLTEPNRNLIVAGPPPQSHVEAPSAVVRGLTISYVDPVVGVYVDGDGAHNVGLSVGSLVIVPEGVRAPVGAHELGHMCGYGHPRRSEGSTIRQPRHRMSAHTDNAGRSTKGMNLRADEIDPSVLSASQP